MVKSITNFLYNSSQQSVDGGSNAYGSNAPEPAVCGLLRVNKMKIEKDKIIIDVKEGYQYDCYISSMGTPYDLPSGFSAWAWINHLRSKNWWDTEKEKKFLDLAEIITYKNG